MKVVNVHLKREGINIDMSIKSGTNRRIAYKYNDRDWTVDLADRHSPNWTKGIEIVKSRLVSRYFKPIDLLINNSDPEIKYNCGFMVMSIDCLLIETLNQFFLGLYNSNELYYLGNPDVNYKYNAQAFRDFFNYSKFFPFFTSNSEAYKEFYGQIRCGLLHQAESKTRSLINIREKEMITPIDPSELAKGIIVNRNLFHRALKLEFEKYIKDLSNPDSRNIKGDFLREKCHRKMLAIVS